MARWMLAFAVAAAVVYVGVPQGRARAFKAGWFERSTTTRRRRSQRRPTHGGVVLAVALAAGALFAGPSQPVARALLLSCLIAVVTGAHAEEGKGRRWVVNLGRVAAAAVIPLVGIRAHLTGGDAVDAVFTALIALTLMGGVRSIERTDATAPLVAAISSLGLLAAAVRADDPVLPAAAAMAGACGAMVANTWPPAIARLGVIGPTVIGAALTAVAIELDPEVAAPRSALVPAFCLVVLAAGAVIPRWDRRLAARRFVPRLVLPIAATTGAVAAAGVDGEWLGLPVACALALGPVGLLAFVGLTAPGERSEDFNTKRWVLGGAAVVVLCGAAALAGLMALDARQWMERGRESATAGLDAARDGDLETAQGHFETADAAFASARRSLNNPLVRIGEVVPVIGPNVRNARTLAAVGGDLSSTAVAVAERAGADDLLVVDGVFPVDAARSVSRELGTALTTLRGASARLDDAASPFLIPPVERGSEEVGERIADATDSIEVAAEGSRLAPALLGADGDRRWMVAVLTPSEQRGAGGLAGDYAELIAHEGDIDLVRTIPASELNAATDPIEQLAVLPEIYRTRYGGFRVGRFWQNLSATPDIPTFGDAIASAYPLTDGGAPVHGVVTIDPHGIAALLELTGPVTVPLWPEPISSENATQVLLFEQYDRLTVDEIETFQGDVVEEVVDALTTGTLPAPSRLASALAPAVTGGHLRLWSPEEDPQALFERIGADGTLPGPSPTTDFVELVTQSASESKIDWYLRRQLLYEPTFDPATGRIDATATVTLTNTAPSSGVSDYVIGEPTGPTVPGENELRVTIYSPHRPIAARDAQGESLAVNIGREKDLYATTVALEIASGGTTTVTFAFEGFLAPNRGQYRLVVGRQPAVVPDSLQVSLEPAEGWGLVGSGDRTSGDDGAELRFRAELVRR